MAGNRRQKRTNKQRRNKQTLPQSVCRERSLLWDRDAFFLVLALVLALVLVQVELWKR